jgi:hypothetical protein
MQMTLADETWQPQDRNETQDRVARMMAGLHGLTKPWYAQGAAFKERENGKLIALPW